MFQLSAITWSHQQHSLPFANSSHSGEKWNQISQLLWGEYFFFWWENEKLCIETPAMRIYEKSKNFVRWKIVENKFLSFCVHSLAFFSVVSPWQLFWGFLCVTGEKCALPLPCRLHFYTMPNHHPRQRQMMTVCLITKDNFLSSRFSQALREWK